MAKCNQLTPLPFKGLMDCVEEGKHRSVCMSHSLYARVPGLAVSELDVTDWSVIVSILHAVMRRF